MSLTKEDIINAIAEMSVMDVVELVSAMEEKFGVSAAAAVVEYNQAACSSFCAPTAARVRTSLPAAASFMTLISLAIASS